VTLTARFGTGCMPVLCPAFLTAALAGCTSGSTIASCVPGASVNCACSNGEVGVQVCQANGTFAACSCSNSSTSGTGATTGGSIGRSGGASSGTTGGSIGGTCEDGSTPCDGGCADLQNDPYNCGDCGHSCVCFLSGGPCKVEPGQPAGDLCILGVCGCTASGRDPASCGDNANGFFCFPDAGVAGVCGCASNSDCPFVENGFTVAACDAGTCVQLDTRVGDPCTGPLDCWSAQNADPNNLAWGGCNEDAGLCGYTLCTAPNVCAGTTQCIPAGSDLYAYPYDCCHGSYAIGIDVNNGSSPRCIPDAGAPTVISGDGGSCGLGVISCGTVFCPADSSCVDGSDCSCNGGFVAETCGGELCTGAVVCSPGIWACVAL
jgi:hypothetical protein